RATEKPDRATEKLVSAKRTQQQTQQRVANKTLRLKRRGYRTVRAAAQKRVRTASLPDPKNAPSTVPRGPRRATVSNVTVDTCGTFSFPSPSRPNEINPRSTRRRQNR